MEVYNSIKTQDTQILKMVKEHISKDAIKLVVQFIQNIIVGDPQNEKNFATILIEDIVSLSKKQDMTYV